MSLPIQTVQGEEALPQLLGDFFPVDVWQRHINRIFYGLRGRQVREFYQTFASADYRLAYALASDYYERARQRAATQPQPSSRPLIIHEWGCGNGNLAACFLDRIQALDKEGAIYPRLHYVLVDSEETVLAGARANPDLAKHQGHYTMMQGDVTQGLPCREGTVDRIFCNELWNELPTKLLLMQNKDIQEEHIRPNLKETRLKDISDWSAFVHAFDQADCQALKQFPFVLDDIVWEREYHKVEGKSLPFRKTVTEFLRKIEGEILIPVNIGAAASLQEAKRVLAPDGLGVSSFDAGTVDWDVLNDPEKPCYGLHGGQFSFMVNFPLLKEIAERIGEEGLTIEPQREFVGRSLDTHVVTLMDILASHPQLPQGGQWEIDRLILKTLATINQSYRSPYSRSLEFPISPDTPESQRQEMEALLTSLEPDGVPDTIAYLTEEEVTRSVSDLEQLGYDRDRVMSVFQVPPQAVDYFHFFYSP